jgi:hypothetical protein
MTNVTDGGLWRGPSKEEWIERIARGATPTREYVDGKFEPWIRGADDGAGNLLVSIDSPKEGCAGESISRAEA